MDLKFGTPLTQNSQKIADRLIDTRVRELELVMDLTEDQLIGPRSQTVEPPIWEMGHVGWFQDRWILQNLDQQIPADKKADSFYDSFNIPNSARWDLFFPSRGQTVEYITDILDQIIARLEGRDPTEKEIYYYTLALNHEEMHSETMHHIRQTFAYTAPMLTAAPQEMDDVIIEEDFEPHDVEIPGGTYYLGATPDLPFVFDNEKWAHPVQVDKFQIAATPVTFAEFQKFVDQGGYQERTNWSDEGWAWLQECGQKHPAFWKKDDQGKWFQRWFDQWKPLEANLPMVHVNWYEAQAYCKWAGRRLPTEAEWELAASAVPEKKFTGFNGEKRWYPWGNSHPMCDQANLDSIFGGIIDVRAFPKGDSAFGLRQMIGNVWEWTEDTFDAFPGYVIDPYATYSEPSFGQQKVLRGGCWATRPHVIRNTFRNFYTPNRNNIFAGFRTVAVS